MLHLVPALAQKRRFDLLAFKKFALISHRRRSFAMHPIGPGWLPKSTPQWSKGIALSRLLICCYLQPGLCSFREGMLHLLVSGIFSIFVKNTPCGTIVLQPSILRCYTVDGRNPAPIDKSCIPLFYGVLDMSGGLFGISSINRWDDDKVWDFFHQQMRRQNRKNTLKRI